MLDLNHPRTQYIFEAAQIEDTIRACLVEWGAHDLRVGPYQAIKEKLNGSIEQLHTLNRTQFGDSSGIAHHLSLLSEAIQANDAQTSWAIFSRMTDGAGENFGTWAI